VLPVRCDAEGALLQLIPERLDIVVREGPRMPQKTRTQIPAASIVESWRRPPKTIVCGGTGTVGALEAPQTITENPLRQGFSAHRCEGRGVESDAGPRDLFGVTSLRVQVSRGRVPFLLRCYGCRP